MKLNPQNLNKNSLQRKGSLKRDHINLLKRQDSQQVAGPSAIYISATSSEDEEEDVGNDEPPCCVCKKHQPPTLNLIYTLEIVNWTQCDECGHWTHLKFCATERVLRRGDMFFVSLLQVAIILEKQAV